MTKLFSLIIFVGAFAWSWHLFNSKNSVGIEIHAGIQSKLAVLIEDTIKKNKPNSSHFQVINIFTEKIDDNKINAHFSFKYDDVMEENEKVSQMLSGEATLTRTLSEDPQIQKWIVQSVKSSASNIEFKEGLVISSDGKSEQPTVTEPTPQTEEIKTE